MLVAAAGERIEHGAHAEALETLWQLDAMAREGDAEAAQGVLDLATLLSASGSGDLEAECASLLARSREALAPGFSG